MSMDEPAGVVVVGCSDLLGIYFVPPLAPDLLECTQQAKPDEKPNDALDENDGQHNEWKNDVAAVLLPYVPAK